MAAGDSVVWDNLSAHAVAGVREAMEARGDPPVLDAMTGAALVEAMAFGRLAFACGAEAIREFLAVVGQDLCDREGAFSTKRNRNSRVLMAVFFGRISMQTQREARSMATNRD